MKTPWIYVMDWIEHEHHVYQISKTPPEMDDARTQFTPEAWEEIIGMYLHRARILGLDNPLGRQSIAKAAATVCGYAESVVRVYGDLPEPGVSSGENANKLWPR